MLGAPAMEANQGKRAYSMIQYLPEMRQSIRTLQSEIFRIALSMKSEESDSEEQAGQ